MSVCAELMTPLALVYAVSQLSLSVSLLGLAQHKRAAGAEAFTCTSRHCVCCRTDRVVVYQCLYSSSSSSFLFYLCVCGL
jgi:hypothetical protein